MKYWTEHGKAGVMWRGINHNSAGIIVILSVLLFPPREKCAGVGSYQVEAWGMENDKGCVGMRRHASSQGNFVEFEQIFISKSDGFGDRGFRVRVSKTPLASGEDGIVLFSTLHLIFCPSTTLQFYLCFHMSVSQFTLNRTRMFLWKSTQAHGIHCNA